jgi:hypothetical protein
LQSKNRRCDVTTAMRKSHRSRRDEMADLEYGVEVVGVTAQPQEPEVKRGPTKLARGIKSTAKPAKATKAAKRDKAEPAKAAKPAPEAKPEPGPNRYLRAARVILAEGEGLGIAELAVKASLSPAAAKYCLEAFKGVCTALREAKLLPQKAVPAKAPVAPKASKEQDKMEPVADSLVETKTAEPVAS